MRFILVCFVAVGCACNNSAAPSFDAGEGVVGPQGEKGEPGLQGIQGPQGERGPQGIQGPPGGALVNINDVTSNSTCPNGGVQLVEADGGAHYICNAAPGAKGDTGAVGMTGPAGAQGPMGPPTPSLSFFSADGGIIGQAMMNPSSGTGGALDVVFAKDWGCVAHVNFNTNKVEGFDGRIYYTGQNCTGTAFIQAPAPMFPATCISAGPQTWKALQPVLVQQMNSQSSYAVQGSTADGGQLVGCLPWVSSGLYGVAAQQVTASNITGPFTFGIP